MSNEKLIREFMLNMGFDVASEHFQATPKRFVETLERFYEGLGREEEVKKLLSVVFPNELGDGVISFHGITGRTLCPHHLMPVLYTAKFAYIPRDKNIGASKIYQAFSLLSSRPYMQEKLTRDFIEMFGLFVDPYASIIQIRGQLTCYEKENIICSDKPMVTLVKGGEVSRYENILLTQINAI